LKKPIRIDTPRGTRFILPREVCTDPETTARIMYGEIHRALKTLRGGSDSTAGTSRVEEEG
jgi:hypothetical protein